MAKVIFTAWKSKSQLVEVRNEFYPPPSYTGPDLRSHGCAVVCDETSFQYNSLLLMLTVQGRSLEIARQCAAPC